MGGLKDSEHDDQPNASYYLSDAIIFNTVTKSGQQVLCEEHKFKFASYASTEKVKDGVILALVED